MSENPPDTVVPLKSPVNIRAYSEVGFANLNNRAMCTIDHLNEDKKWDVIARHHINKLRKNGELTFGDALQAMEAGYMVRRRMWSRDTPNLGLDPDPPKGPEHRKENNASFSGHSCTRKPDCKGCESDREFMARHFPRGKFFHQGSPRFRTNVEELVAQDLLAKDWVVLGKERTSEEPPPA